MTNERENGLLGRQIGRAITIQDIKGVLPPHAFFSKSADCFIEDLEGIMRDGNWTSEIGHLKLDLNCMIFVEQIDYQGL